MACDRDPAGPAPRRAETGAALLTVLLLVAILAVIAALALERLTLASRMTRNIVSADQGRAYMLAAEQIAATRIADLLAVNKDRTTLAGDWVGVPQTMGVPGGTVTALLRDAGNCFNLNSLVFRGERAPGSNAPEPLVARQVAITQFAGLMRLLGIEIGRAEQVAVSVADWIDTDMTPGPGGAEDEHYGGFSPAYRTANALIADPSELRMVQAVTPEIYERLRPWVCALPVTDLSPINVNTLLPGQAVLLAMIAPDRLSIEQARQVLARRPPDGYGSLIAFWNQPPLPALGLNDAAKQQLQQKSRWFEIGFSADLGGDRVEETVLYDAGGVGVRVVRRQWLGAGE
jgi:general secretion pathway protein K